MPHQTRRAFSSPPSPFLGLPAPPAARSAMPPAVVPTASLDFGNQVRVLRQICSLAERGMAVILSTHDPDHALSVGHRVALLQGGELVALGPPAEVLDGDRLEALYGVAVEIVRLADGRRVCLPRL